MLARASYYKHVSLGPQDLDRSLGAYDRIRRSINRYVPNTPLFQGGGGCYKAEPELPGEKMDRISSSSFSCITLNLQISYFPFLEGSSSHLFPWRRNTCCPPSQKHLERQRRADIIPQHVCDEEHAKTTCTVTSRFRPLLRSLAYISTLTSHI